MSVAHCVGFRHANLLLCSIRDVSGSLHEQLASLLDVQQLEMLSGDYARRPDDA